jgi:hypothetical protein
LWSAPEGSEYVIDAGTVTAYPQGEAPSLYADSSYGSSPDLTVSTPTYILPDEGASTHAAPTYTPPACSESGSCYGDISDVTGLPKTVYVHGYYRRDGTYVRSYYRSHR